MNLKNRKKIDKAFWILIFFFKVPYLIVMAPRFFFHFKVDKWESARKITDKSMLQPEERRLLGKKIALSGAWLLMVGLVTGLWAGAALTGTVVVRQPRLALASHLNALLGGLWLVAVASTLDYLKLNANQIRKLAVWIKLPTWANWLITLIASFLGVNGLTYTGDKANDTIALFLQALVVLPSLVGGVLWIRGFYLEPKK